MAWEKLYVEEAEMTFRYFTKKTNSSMVPFQFILRGYEMTNGDWLVELAQEDPNNDDVEILIAKNEYDKSNIALEAWAQKIVGWATDIIQLNYFMAYPPAFPEAVTDELYQPW